MTAATSAPAWLGRSWTFIVEGTPQPKQRARHDHKRRGAGPRVEAKTLNFEQRVAGAAIVAGVSMPEGGAMRVDVELWLPDRKAKDGDNIVKAVLDGLQKAGNLVLPDDSLRYVPRGAWALAGYSPVRPRTVVTVTLVEPVVVVDEADAVGSDVVGDCFAGVYL